MVSSDSRVINVVAFIDIITNTIHNVSQHALLLSMPCSILLIALLMQDLCGRPGHFRWSDTVVYYSLHSVADASRMHLLTVTLLTRLDWIKSR